MRPRLIVAGIFSLAIVGCGTEPAPYLGSDPATEKYAASLGVDIAQMTEVNTALYKQDLVVGTGATAANGDTLRVTYTGWLISGVSFDSNVGKTPLPFVLGAGQVIPGWDQGMIGVQVGGKRRLVIGSRLAYGQAGAGCDQLSCVIPPNSTLVFDVQLVSKSP